MSKDKSNKGWFGRHKVLTVLGVIVLLIVIGSVISAGSNKTTVTTTATNTKSSSSTSNSSGSSSAAAKVGDTVEIGGSKGLAVTLNQVIDPASPSDSALTANAGDRYIAVDVKIVNNGTTSYSDDANNDVSLIGTDNQTYTADFDTVSECTNFNSGQYTLAPGQSTTGCVVFQVPDAVNTAKVEFQVQNGLSQSTGEWSVQ